MGETKELAKKKKFKMPHTLVIIFIIILAAVLFTWIVPSGEYVQIEDPVTGRELIDPDSFHFVENTPVNPLRIMNYIIDGFMDAADLIFMLMFAGGAFHLITESGALQASIAKVARKFSNRFYIFIPMLTLIFTLIATNQGVNLFIPFVPITVMLSFALGLDSLVGVSIILLGGAVGFSTGTLQTSTTLLAQEIAGLVPFSGIWYRAICLVVFWVITNIFLIRYAMRIKKNPQLSPMYDLDQQSEMKASTTDLSSFGELNWRRVAILAALVIVLAIIVYGGLTLDWDMAEFAAMFLWLGIAVGLLAGKSLSDIAKGIVAGSKTMLGAVMIVGSARSIALILTDGGVMDTIVHVLAGGLDLVPTVLQAPAMFLICTVFNVFMASGSGQAAVMMPLLLPVADLVGMTRQTVILAFNFGDGFGNYISLKREDAARLGYDNAKAWMNLLRANRNDIAAAMNIPPNHFRWYAAYHDEGDHPHVHIMAWSTVPGEAYHPRSGTVPVRQADHRGHSGILHRSQEKRQAASHRALWRGPVRPDRPGHPHHSPRRTEQGSGGETDLPQPCGQL